MRVWRGSQEGSGEGGKEDVGEVEGLARGEGEKERGARSRMCVLVGADEMVQTSQISCGRREIGEEHDASDVPTPSPAPDFPYDLIPIKPLSTARSIASHSLGSWDPF